MTREHLDVLDEERPIAAGLRESAARGDTFGALLAATAELLRRADGRSGETAVPWYGH
jgi:hypothetical protein